MRARDLEGVEIQSERLEIGNEIGHRQNFEILETWHVVPSSPKSWLLQLARCTPVGACHARYYPGLIVAQDLAGRVRHLHMDVTLVEKELAVDAGRSYR